MNEPADSKQVFKYKLSFYYVSTIIYFVVFLLYVIIRGEFVEDSFKLITKDPIIYFFALIVSISLIGLLYNLYKNRYMEIGSESFSFVSRNRTKVIEIKNIVRIKISSDKSSRENGAFRLIRIKLKNRRRLLLIRPSDYENSKDLLRVFQNINSKIEKS